MMCEKWKKKSEFTASIFCCCFDECALIWLIFENDLNQ